MRLNEPVTQRERAFTEGVIVSRTDPKGRITFVNRAFVEISGFREDELVGQPHNLIRHPDMPPAAFADMWTTLKKGRPWIGVVKNRCANGDHYWVEAHVTPEWHEGTVTGYLSVRRPVERARIEEAERTYARIRGGQLRRFTLRNGVVTPPDPLRDWNPLWRLHLRTRLYLLSFFGIGLAAALMEGVALGVDRAWLWGALAAGAAFAAYSAHWLGGDLDGRLDGAVKVFRRMAGGQFDDPIDISRSDEVGRVLLGLKSMQTRLGYDLLEARERSASMARALQALDVAEARLMVANDRGEITYFNASLRALLVEMAPALKAIVPGFDVDALIGRQMADISPDPVGLAARLKHLAGSDRRESRIGPHTVLCIANPVLGAGGERLGTIMEWQDRTRELAIEAEVDAVVQAATHGDLSRRIPLEGKQGFMRGLSEGVNALLAATAANLAEINRVLAAMATGDLRLRIDTEYEGVFGEMQRATNATVEELSAIVRHIQQATEAIHTAAGEIAAGNQDLSRRTEQQAANLEETASSMEELTGTVKLNAANAHESQRLASGAATVAARGADVVEQTVSPMQAIAEQSKKSEDIIGVIDGIAFQTHLRALHAAVEAARAGDQGRGFAVVAGVVRTLAQRSAAAAKEVRALITRSVETVHDGATHAAQAGATMREVVEAVKRVDGMMAEIAAASAEQGEGIEAVNRTVNQLDAVTQQNAALVEEASAAAASMEDQAVQLRDAVATFRA